MAETDIFGEVGGKIVDQVFSGIIWFGVALILLVVVGGLFYYYFVYKRKFDIRVKIISDRANDRHKIIFDKAAILKERKSKVKYFRIWGLQVELTIPAFNVLQNSNQGDYLELYRPSEDVFYFLTPAKIIKTYVIKSDGKKHSLTSQEHNMMDTDINYWNTKRKTDNKKMFSTESLIMKLLPYVGVILGGVIMIFMLYILLDHLPGILSELKSLVTEMKSLKAASVKTGVILPWLL